MTDLVYRYKILTLRMLLDRRLGNDDNENVFAHLDITWERMTDLEREVVDSWVRKLPQDLRRDGPDVADGWERASGDCECSACGLLYRDHPIDTRNKDFELHVTCDGNRWKL